MNLKYYVIAGPTASGKSDFAHRLALATHGTIINCDSVQIYRGIETISASPITNTNLTEIDGIPYRMFSILDLDTQISVGQYLARARTEFDAAIATGRTPIFVGGTGYYINAILNGISPMPEISDDVRRTAREMVARDINAARAKIGPTAPIDPQRISRALEVLLQTGRQITEFQSMPRVGAMPGAPVRILINPPRPQLLARIATRVHQMMHNGAIEEGNRIIKNHWNPNRAIGAAQICDYLAGKITMDECVENWITKTNQYAKRQSTWFRTQFVADKIIPHIPRDSDINLILD